jgi:hypothetical protein
MLSILVSNKCSRYAIHRYHAEPDNTTNIFTSLQSLSYGTKQVPDNKRFWHLSGVVEVILALAP